MLTRHPLTSYPSILEVMSLLDCSVIQDLSDVDNGKAVFALGDDAEPAAGMHGFTASPYLNTLAELDQFCAKNLDQYQAIADVLDRTNALPDVWFWDIPVPANIEDPRD